MSNKFRKSLTFRNEAAITRVQKAYRKQLGLGIDGLPRRYGPVKKIAVKLSLKDWKDLWNFVNGDLANMPEGDEIKEQMEGVCREIQNAILTSEYAK